MMWVVDEKPVINNCWHNIVNLNLFERGINTLFRFISFCLIYYVNSDLFSAFLKRYDLSRRTELPYFIMLKKNNVRMHLSCHTDYVIMTIYMYINEYTYICIQTYTV